MSGPVRPPLTVSDVDDGGSTTGRPINRIEVTDGTLTITGTTAKISTGGGGSGTVTSVGLTESGSALTITGSPITTSGTINIAGAGTSSQVILGDLSLGTLPSDTTYTIGAATSGSDAEIQLDASTGTDTAVKLAAGSNITITESGGDTITIDSSGGSVTYPLEAPDGSAAAPSYSFSSDNNTGFSWIGVDTIGVSTGGTFNHKFQTGSFQGPSGSNISPAFSFTADTDTGFGRWDTNELFFATGGTRRLSIESDGAVDFLNSIIKIGGSLGSDGQVLTSTGTGAAWEDAAGGGGSPGGSDTMLQYNDGGSFGGASAITYTDTAGSEQLLIDDTSDQPLVKIVQQGTGAAFEVHDQATDSSIFAVDPSGAVLVGYAAGTGTVLKFLVSGSAGADYFLAANDGNAGTPVFSRTNESDTGLFFPSTNNTLAVTTGGSERFRFGASGELLISGTDAGTSGQVFTSAGASASPTWEDAGGGGSGFVAPQIGTGTFLSSYDAYYMNGAPYGVGAVENESYTDYQTNGIYRPMVMPEGGTWGGVEIQVSSASTGNALLVSLYESDTTTGMPTSFVGYCDVATTSTGAIAQTTTLDSTGSSATISLTAAKQYWVAVVAKGNSDTFSLSCAKTEALSPLSATNMGSQFTVVRNLFVSNDIETTNPPRIGQLLERNFPLVGVIIS